MSSTRIDVFSEANTDFAPDLVDAGAQAARDLGVILAPSATVPLVFSGPVSAVLAQQPFSEGIPDVVWNVDEPETVSHAHALFRDAGADVAITNTLQATTPSLEALGVNLTPRTVASTACRCAFSCGPRFVVGAIGPCGLPTGAGVADADEATLLRSRSRGAYTELARALVEGGVHAVLVCGMRDVSDAENAIAGVLRVCVRPVIASVSVDGTGRLPDSGASLEEAFASLSRAGADAVGIDGIDVDAVVPLADRIARAAAAVDRRVVVRPSATKPLDVEGFGRAADAFSVAGIGLVGGGRGATPPATGVMADRLFQA